MVRDATDKKNHEVARACAQRRAAITLDSIGDAVLSTDMHGKVTYLNRVAELLTGWSFAEAVGRPLTQVFALVDEATRRPVPDPLLRAVREYRAVPLTGSCVLLHKDGRDYPIEYTAAPIRTEDGQMSGAVIVFRDVGRLRANARDMAHLAQHDTLTDLPNRLLFGERVADAIVLARRHRRHAALLYLDLDGFKAINDTQGHAFGDKLLLAVTRRLVDGVRASDTVCRQGGDEFVILLSEIDGPHDAAASAGKLVRKLAEPHLIDGRALCVTVSVGISLYPRDGQDVETLLRVADRAMYEAKHEGRDRYRFITTMAVRDR